MLRSLAFPVRRTATAVAAPRASPLAMRLRMYSEQPSDTKADDKAEAKAEPSESEKKTAELETTVKDLTKDLQYLRADYQTLARRARTEKQQAGEAAVGAFAADVLETTDVLDKALASVPLEAREKDAALAGLYEGVVLTRRALAQTLAHEGVVPMPDSAGAKFDPKRHEALAQVEEGTPGEIAEVVEPGWMIRDRVLRPAKVNVVKIE